MCRGCDVLLDTVFFNAQTTAADFIWAAVLASILTPPRFDLSLSRSLTLSLGHAYLYAMYMHMYILMYVLYIHMRVHSDVCVVHTCACTYICKTLYPKPETLN